jgi:hypothetical protein
LILRTNLNHKDQHPSQWWQISNKHPTNRIHQGTATYGEFWHEYPGKDLHCADQLCEEPLSNPTSWK